MRAITFVVQVNNPATDYHVAWTVDRDCNVVAMWPSLSCVFTKDPELTYATWSAGLQGNIQNNQPTSYVEDGWFLDGSYGGGFFPTGLAFPLFRGEVIYCAHFVQAGVAKQIQLIVDP